MLCVLLYTYVMHHYIQPCAFLIPTVTCFQYSPVQQPRVQKGLVFTRADLRPDQFRVGGQYSGALFVQVDSSHGSHVVDVIVIPVKAEKREGSTRR